VADEQPHRLASQDHRRGPHLTHSSEVRIETCAVTTDRAPAAQGPYSQAIVAGDFVFCSGTVGIDPVTGVVAEGIQAQTEQALTNLAAILEAAGSSFAEVVKTTIFYAEVDHFPAAQRGARATHAGPAAGPVRTGQRPAAAGPPGDDRGHRDGARRL